MRHPLRDKYGHAIDVHAIGQPIEVSAVDLNRLLDEAETSGPDEARRIIARLRAKASQLGAAATAALDTNNASEDACYWNAQCQILDQMADLLESEGKP